MKERERRGAEAVDAAMPIRKAGGRERTAA